MYGIKRFCIPIRYVILLLLCFYCIGFMVINDIPGSLQHAIMSTFEIDAYTFSLLFSLAAWPSCFGFLNGFIIDKYLGVRLATFIYVVVLTAGNILFLLGSFLKNYPLLITGRILYGLGADPMMLCINAFILHWFTKSNELNMVFAMITSLPWLGSALVFFASNRIYQHVIRNYLSLDALGVAVSAGMSFTIVMIIPSIVLGLMYNKPPDRTQKQSDEKVEPTSKPSFKEIFKFPFLFWLFTVAINLYFLNIVTFLMMSQNFFTIRYKMSLDSASNMSSTFGLVTCVLSSPLGFLVDKVGRNLIFVSMSVFFGLLAHGIMAFSTSNPFAAVVALSLSYSLMTSSYLPLLSFLVEKHQTTTAYGIAQSGMNGSFAIGSLLVGHIIATYSYEVLEKFYFYLLLGTVPLWILVWIINWVQGDRLNLSAAQKLYKENINSSNGASTDNKFISEPIGLTTPPALKRIQSVDIQIKNNGTFDNASK